MGPIRTENKHSFVTCHSSWLPDLSYPNLRCLAWSTAEPQWPQAELCEHPEDRERFVPCGLFPHPPCSSPAFPPHIFGNCLMSVSRRPGWVQLTTVNGLALQNGGHPPESSWAVRSARNSAVCTLCVIVAWRGCLVLGGSEKGSLLIPVGWRPERTAVLPS